MNFAERVAANPLALVSGCLVWIPIAIWVIALIHWMVQGDLDVGFGLLGVSAGIGLGALTLLTPIPSHAPILFVVALSVVVLFPVLRAFMHRHALAQMDVEQVERAYDLLDAKPDNMAAKLRLARVLYDRGICGPAIGIAEDALAAAPPKFFQDEARMLQQWKVRTVDLKSLGSVACLKCGHKNDVRNVYCSQCTSPYLLAHAKGRWVDASMAHRLIACWVIALLLLVGIPFTAAGMPPALSVPLIFVELAIGLVLLWRAFGTFTGDASN